MDPKQLTVTVNDVTLTEAQVDAAAGELKRKRALVAERAKRVSREVHYSSGYAVIPKAVVFEMADALRGERASHANYACIRPDGDVCYDETRDGAPRVVFTCGEKA